MKVTPSTIVVIFVVYSLSLLCTSEKKIFHLHASENCVCLFLVKMEEGFSMVFYLLLENFFHITYGVT